MFDISSKYPIEFYELTQKIAPARSAVSDGNVRIVESELGTNSEIEGFWIHS